MLMDQVDTLHGGRYWPEVLCCTITIHMSDLEVKVTDLTILCQSFWLIQGDPEYLIPLQSLIILLQQHMNGYWANETQFKMYNLYLIVVVCYAHDVFTTILRFCFDVFLTIIT